MDLPRHLHSGGGRPRAAQVSLRQRGWGWPIWWLTGRASGPLPCSAAPAGNFDWNFSASKGVGSHAVAQLSFAAYKLTCLQCVIILRCVSSADHYTSELVNAHTDASCGLQKLHIGAYHRVQCSHRREQKDPEKHAHLDDRI